MKNKEFLQEYGDQEVEFHSYYKYVFTFRSGGDTEEDMVAPGVLGARAPDIE